MPLKLVPPRKGKSPNFTIRGSYLRTRVDTTSGTANEKIARKQLHAIERDIECGNYPPKPAPLETPAEPTFADAALAYLRADGDPSHLSRIIEQSGPHALRDKRLRDIDQIAIDNAANALYPNAPATTKNRQFYTPVSAVMKRAGIERQIKRPKGWRGSKATTWMEPDQAFAALDAAYDIDPEFGLLCETYLYTGERMSTPLKARLRDLRIDQAMLYVPTTKNGDPRPVHLPPWLVDAFRRQPPRIARPRSNGIQRLRNGLAGRSRDETGVPFLDRSPDAKLFRFHAGGKLRSMLNLAFKNAGLSFPKRQGGFHLFCHCYGTWMKRYGKLDSYGMVRTGRWKDAESADRYNHTEASEEARRADWLPAYKPRARRGKSVEIRTRKKKA